MTQSFGLSDLLNGNLTAEQARGKHRVDESASVSVADLVSREKNQPPLVDDALSTDTEVGNIPTASKPAEGWGELKFPDPLSTPRVGSVSSSSLPTDTPPADAHPVTLSTDHETVISKGGFDFSSSKNSVLESALATPADAVDESVSFDTEDYIGDYAQETKSHAEVDPVKEPPSVLHAHTELSTPVPALDRAELDKIVDESVDAVLRDVPNVHAVWAGLGLLAFFPTGVLALAMSFQTLEAAANSEPQDIVNSSAKWARIYGIVSIILGVLFWAAVVGGGYTFRAEILNLIQTYM